MPQNYFDLVVNYKLGKNTSLTLGVNNIADKEPPMGWGWGPGGNAAGFYGTYDAAGRYIHGSVLFNL